MPERLATLTRTKFHRPRITSDLIHRPRLLDQLNDGLDHWLTLVCAPAGFGKTTLVSAWIESLYSNPDSLGVAWLSLDQDDSDVAVFTQYLIAAISTIFKGACTETLHLLRGPQLPPLKLIAATLSNEIEQLPERFILVLDDYNTVRGEAVPGLLNELLQHWPQPLHLVLISRNNPPLPLPRLRANGQLTEIRSNDLRFDRVDTGTFLTRALKTPLSEHAVEVLSERTEGWVSALRLAILSLHSAMNVNDRIINMSGSEENIAEYLTNEVLAHQLPVIQTFLKKTSILDRFCAPLCEAVIGELDPAWDVQACIDWLGNEDLFIVSLDDHHYWYRYHHLFQDLLKERARIELGTEQLTNLQSRAAAWFAQQGMMDQALQYSLEASDFELVAQLLSESFGEMLNREDRSALERYLYQVPEEFIQKRPELLIIKAWIYQFAWQLDAQIKVVQQVEALLDVDQETRLSTGILKTLRGQIAGLKAQFAYFNNQPDLVLTYSQEALACIPDSWKYLRGGVIFYQGLGLRANGDRQAAERLLLDEFEAQDDKSNTYALQLINALCMIYLYNADLDKVYRTAKLMLSLAEASGLMIKQGWARFFLGIALYQWNDLEAAAEHFEYLAEHRFTAQVLSARDGITGMALIHQIRGESAKALEMLDLLSQIDLERMGAEIDRTRSLRARLKLLEGDLESAMSWADGFIAPPSNQPLTWLETPHLTLVRILLTRKLPADVLMAHQVLDELAAIAERTYNVRFMIEILAMRALALAAQGNSAVALDTLQQAVDLARPGGFIRIFVDLGPSMLKLLAELARTGHSTETIQKILDAFPDRYLQIENNEAQAHSNQSSIDGKSKTLVESLTTREREILLYLREPTSLKDIAVKLSISYATIKRHTINIYGKLGVNSRWDAVTRANELDLFHSR